MEELQFLAVLCARLQKTVIMYEAELQKAAEQIASLKKDEDPEEEPKTEEGPAGE